MTKVVGSGVHAHAAQARRKKRPAAAAAPVAVPAGSAVPLPGAARLTGAGVLGQPAPAAAAAAAPPAAVKSPEYQPVDLVETLAGVLGGQAGGLAADRVRPYTTQAANNLLNPELHPWFGSPAGKVVPAKLGGAMTSIAGNLVSSAVSDSITGVLHRGADGDAKFKLNLPQLNDFYSKLVRSIVVSWAETAVLPALTPPPPPSQPGVTAAGSNAPVGKSPGAPTPTSGTPVPLPPVPNPTYEAMHQPIGPVFADARVNILKTIIGAVYDQTLNPVVQKATNLLTGHWDAPVKRPEPLTPGKLASGFVQDMVTPFLVPSLKFGADVKPGFGGSLGLSIANNLLGTAFDAFYSRGMGPAITNAVNGALGIRSKEELEKAKLTAGEQLLRAAPRAAAVGATTYFVGTALNATFVKLGASIGGVGGALTALAGSALLGSVAAQIVDATLGPMLGKMGAALYSAVTGKPTYEQRMQQANPGPTPGDPVKAPNGNPGTVPAPPAPPTPPGSAQAGSAATPPPAAPAAGKLKKRAKLGMPAVDATSPAINLPLALLQAAALRG